MAYRPRWPGDASQFAEIMMPFATSKNFILYDEAKTVTNTKVMPEKVLAASDVLARWHDEFPTLLFIKSVSKQGFGLIFDAKQKELKFHEKFRSEWVTVMTNRWHNLCRVVNQGYQVTAIG